MGALKLCGPLKGMTPLTKKSLCFDSISGSKPVCSINVTGFSFEEALL